MLVIKELKKFSLKRMANLQFLKSGYNYVHVTTYNLPVKEYVTTVCNNSM